MAKNNSRYIQFYTPGSVACKVELRQEQEWAPLPKFELKPRTVIHVDPIALVGCIVAVCMLGMMAVGIGQLNESRKEVAVMVRYVAQLTAENQELKETYASGYDLEDIRKKAENMGMVPADQVPQTQIYLTMPQTEVVGQETLWQRIGDAVTNLFA